MPFTVTHIAAAVPVAWLCRWRVPFSALAIGSMIPDTSGYFPMLVDHVTTHSARGIATHCTPIGVVLFYLYHGMLKRPLIDLLPTAMRDRLRSWAEQGIDFSPLAVLATVVCVALGAATHLLWDSFSHGGDSWGVMRYPVLATAAFEIQGRGVRWYSLIQHGSSLVLLPPLLVGFWVWVRRQPPSEQGDERARMPLAVSWSVIALWAVGMVLYYQTLRESSSSEFGISAAQATVKQGGAIAIVMTLIYCLGMQWLWWREKANQEKPWQLPQP